ncbi:MAG: signal peptide prediction [Burkholderiaceae bacterium]
MTAVALLRYAWAAPATLVGLLAAGSAMSLGARARVVRGVIEVTGGGLAGVVARLPVELRFSAITLGHVILGIAPDELDRVRSHEQAHVRQYERWGLLFFALYAGASMVAWLRHRSPYWHNHFECEARREAELEEQLMAAALRGGARADEVSPRA